MIRLGGALAAMMLLGACSGTLGVPYDIKSTEELVGWMSVERFDYTPAPPTAPNQIKNTAAGSIFMEEPVATFVGEGLKKELRISGISIRPDGPCGVLGTVQKFEMDDLGYSITWSSLLRYEIVSGGKTVYDKAFASSFRTEKSILIANTSISRMASEPHLALLRDTDFRQVLRQLCRPAPAS